MPDYTNDAGSNRMHPAKRIDEDALIDGAGGSRGSGEESSSAPEPPAPLKFLTGDGDGQKRRLPPPEVVEELRAILVKEYPELETASPNEIWEKSNAVVHATRLDTITPMEQELDDYAYRKQQAQTALEEAALDAVYGNTPRHVENTGRLKEIGDAIIEDAVQNIPPTEAENIFNEYNNPDDRESAAECFRRQNEVTSGSSPAGRETLALLKRVGNVLEVGSGNGYWAHEAKQAGVDIIATDINPVSPEGKGMVVKRPQPHAHLVRKMDLVQATRAWPDRNLLTLYLPARKVIHDLNENFRGRYLMAAGSVDEQNRFEDHYKGRLRNYEITAVVPMPQCGLKPDAQPGGMALALYERKDLLNQAGDGAVTTLLPNAGRDRFPAERERLGYADPERNDSPSERLRRGDRRRQPDYKRNRRDESDLDSFDRFAPATASAGPPLFATGKRSRRRGGRKSSRHRVTLPARA